MSPYWFIARLRVLLGLNYRTEVVAGLCGQFLLVYASLFLWRSAYAGRGEVAGVAREDMLSFVVLSMLLGFAYTVGVHRVVPQKIQQGTIAVDWLRPVHPLAMWLAEDFGSAFSEVMLRGTPLLLASLLIVPFPAAGGGWEGLLAAPAFFLSYLIVWLLYALVAMLAFWIIELGNFGLVVDVCVRFLSGGIVPFWFFPDWAQSAAKWLPFVYTYQGVIGIYLGVERGAAAWRILGIQALWIALLATALAVVWSRARHKVMVQGG